MISFGVAVVLLAAFVVIENTARAVLIERALRRTRSLRLGAAATALYMASAGSEFYLVTLLLQERQGYPPLRAGLAFLPLALMITAGSMMAGRAARRLTAAAVLACGFTLAAIGLGWLALALPGGSYLLDLLPGLVISGFGHGLIYTSMFILGTRDVPARPPGQRRRPAGHVPVPVRRGHGGRAHARARRGAGHRQLPGRVPAHRRRRRGGPRPGRRVGSAPGPGRRDPRDRGQ